MARVQIPKHEKRNEKAGDLWSNLAQKLNLGRQMMKLASKKQRVEKLSDTIQMHASHVRDPRAIMPVTDPVIRRVADEAGLMRKLTAMVKNAIEVFTGDKVGSTEEYAKVKGAVDSVMGTLERSAAVLGTRAQDHIEKASELQKVVAGLGDKEIQEVPSYKTALDQTWELLNVYENEINSIDVGNPALEQQTMGPLDSVTPGAPLQASIAGESLDLQMAQA